MSGSKQGTAGSEKQFSQLSVDEKVAHIQRVFEKCEFVEGTHEKNEQARKMQHLAKVDEGKVEEKEFTPKTLELFKCDRKVPERVKSNSARFTQGASQASSSHGQTAVARLPPQKGFSDALAAVTKLDEPQSKGGLQPLGAAARVRSRTPQTGAERPSPKPPPGPPPDCKSLPRALSDQLLDIWCASRCPVCKKVSSVPQNQKGLHCNKCRCVPLDPVHKSSVVVTAALDRQVVQFGTQLQTALEADTAIITYADGTSERVLSTAICKAMEVPWLELRPPPPQSELVLPPRQSESAKGDSATAFVPSETSSDAGLAKGMSKRQKKKLTEASQVVPSEQRWVNDIPVAARAPVMSCSARDFDPNTADFKEICFVHQKLKGEIRRKIIASLMEEYDGWVEEYKEELILKMSADGFDFLTDSNHELTKVCTQKACQDWVNTLHHTKMPWSDMPAEIDNNGEPQLHECQGCLAKQCDSTFAEWTLGPYRREEVMVGNFGGGEEDLHSYTPGKGPRLTCHCLVCVNDHRAYRNLELLKPDTFDDIAKHSWKVLYAKAGKTRAMARHANYVTLVAESDARHTNENGEFIESYKKYRARVLRSQYTVVSTVFHCFLEVGKTMQEKMLTACFRYMELRSKRGDDTFYSVATEKTSFHGAQWIEDVGPYLKEVWQCRGCQWDSDGLPCGAAIKTCDWGMRSEDGGETLVPINRQSYRCPLCGRPWVGKTKGLGTLPWTRTMVVGHPDKATMLSHGDIIPPGRYRVIPLKWKSCQEENVTTAFKEVANEIDDDLSTNGVSDEELIRRCRLLPEKQSAADVAAHVDKDWCYHKIAIPEEIMATWDKEAEECNASKTFRHALKLRSPGDRWCYKHLPQMADGEGKMRYYANAIKIKWPDPPAPDYFDLATKMWKVLTQEERRKEWLLACGALGYEELISMWCTVCHMCMKAYEELYGEDALQDLVGQWKGDFTPEQIEIGRAHV